MWGWPANTEQFGEHRFSRFDQACLVRRVSAALFRHQKTGATDHGLRSGIEASLGVGASSDPSSREDRIVIAHRRADASKQLERRHRPPNVTSGLDALGDHRIGSSLAGRQHLLD